MSRLSRYFLVSLCAIFIFTGAQGSDQTRIDLKVQALAGGWSSTGGGGIYKDAHNPWFLPDVQEIRYCVIIDEANFGASSALVENQIQRAFDFWKREFPYSMPLATPKSGVKRLGQQNATRIPCGPSVDIEFRFGKLTSEQQAFIHDVRRVGAVTIRTSYSARDLRGRGFVYVAPMQGELAFDSRGLAKDAWVRDQGERLYLVLVHELGHVFGIPHFGSQGDLMSEGFVEGLLAEDTDPVRASSLHKSFFFPVSGVRAFCVSAPLSEQWQKFFALKKTQGCLRFQIEHDSRDPLFGATQVSVSTAEKLEGPWEPVGHGELRMKRFHPTQTSLIWLTEEQDIFAREALLQLKFPAVLGVALLEVSKAGAFLSSKDSRRRGLILRFEQGKNSFRLDGLDAEGEVFTLL